MIPYHKSSPIIDITKIADETDMMFIRAVQEEVTQTCALPFALPIERIPAFIRQAAMYFWQNDDLSVEHRMYVIKNEDICKDGSHLNKIIKLPSQIVSVHGCYKTRQHNWIGAMGDFSLERMMLSSYAGFGGGNSTANGVGVGTSPAGWNLIDVVSSMFEISTFDQTMNAPLTYDYNTYSSQLVLLGDLGKSDLLLKCFVRCRIQDLYNNYYFFRKVVCLAKKALHTIYGSFEFKLPGGVTINHSNFKDDAESEEAEIKEYIENNRSNPFIMMPNTI